MHIMTTSMHDVNVAVRACALAVITPRSGLNSTLIHGKPVYRLKRERLWNPAVSIQIVEADVRRSAQRPDSRLGDAR